MNLNQLQIIGRLGQNAKIINHQDRLFISFSVAVDDSYTDNSGAKIERAVWYECVSESESHRKLSTWLTKGREVFVQGKPSLRYYTDQNQQTKASIRILIHNLSLGVSPADQVQAPAVAQVPPGGGPLTRPVQTSPAQSSPADDDDQLPF